MDYLFKASLLLVVFFIFYKILLQKETFFNANRAFLGLGLVISLLLPLLVIPIYIEQIIYANSITSAVSSEIIEVQPTVNLQDLLLLIYFSGVLFFGSKFLFQLISLIHLLISKQKKYINGFWFINDKNNKTPFSFFRFIVYNKEDYSTEELEQIFIHEKMHAKHLHSVDVLIANIANVILWFNPVIWLYKKEIEQNLEFIADSESEKHISCIKKYQHLLLRTSVTNHTYVLTNNFYNSLIKKRIIMLQKNKSQKINQLKFGLIIPLLVVFIALFNTKTIAQTKVVEEVVEVDPSSDVDEVIEIKENVEVVVINKNTKDFSSIKESLAENGVTLKVKNVKRNEDDEITSIKIEASSKSSSADFNSSNSDGISPITISVSDEGKQISIGNSSENHHNGNFVFETNDGNHFVYANSSKDKFVIKTDDDDEEHEIIEIKGDGEDVFIIRKNDGDHEIHEIKSEDGDKIIEIKIDNDADKTVWVNKNDKTIEVIKDEDFELIPENPLILLDGKEISSEEMDEIDSEMIEKINIIKNESAIEKYGDKAKNGVIEITTKK